MASDKLFLEEKETGRIEAFSDGVFAIAITLLVLDIKVPHIHDLPSEGGLIRALLGLWPAYMAYIISFATILIIWINHHRLFNYIKKSDDAFLFLNGFLLFLVALVPFPTALLSEYVTTPHAHIVSAIYSGLFLAVAVSLQVLWGYASKDKKLISKNADQCFVDNISRQYRYGPPLYFLAFILSFIWVPASIAMCLLLAVFFSVTGVITKMYCEIELKQEKA
jgi:uncharacterized membrane protein